LVCGRRETDEISTAVAGSRLVTLTGAGGPPGCAALVDHLLRCCSGLWVPVTSGSAELVFRNTSHIAAFGALIRGQT
jgi:hypothetical protein